MVNGTLNETEKDLFIDTALILLTRDENLFYSIIDVLDESFFILDYHRYLVQILKDLYAELHKFPSIEVIYHEVSNIKKEDLRNRIVHLLNSAKYYYDDEQIIKERFIDFIKEKCIEFSVDSLIHNLKNRKYDEVLKKIQDITLISSDTDVGIIYNEDIAKRYKNVRRKVIPTSISSLDKNIGGGVGKGDLAVVIGLYGGGKSWFLIKVSAEAMLRGYNVIYYSYELGEEYIARRFDSYFTGIPLDNLINMTDTINYTLSTIKGNLIIKKFNQTENSLSAIESHIMMCKIRNKVNPDMIVIDYADYIKIDLRGKNYDIYDEEKYLYQSLRGLAEKYDCVLWTAAQVNRHGEDREIIKGSEIAGAHRKLHIPDITVSFTRTEEDRRNNQGRIYVIKNRYGKDNFIIDCYVDFSRAILKEKTDKLEEIGEDIF